MMPIPAKLLPHSCTMKVLGPPDVFGDRQLKEEYLLERVCIVPEMNVKSDIKGTVHSNSGKMYFDCVNSIPKDADFMAEDCRNIILFDNKEFAVTSVKKLYDENRLHHIEIGLGEV